MNANISFHEIYNDAGYLREFIARQFGQVLIYGGDAERYFRGLRLLRRLKSLAGLTEKQAMKNLREDVANLEVEDSQ